MGRMLPGIKHAFRNGWPSGALSTLPSIWSCLLKRSSEAGLWPHLFKTVALDTLEIYACLTPMMCRKQRFWKPFSFLTCETVRHKLLSP